MFSYLIRCIEKMTLREGHFFYGPDGIRTHDLCVANAALSQLSYKPDCESYYNTTARLCQQGFGKKFSHPRFSRVGRLSFLSFAARIRHMPDPGGCSV